jgi:hypothetical protein
VRTRLVAAKLDRLKDLSARRTRWQTEVSVVRRMHTRVLEAERILSGDALRADNLSVTNASVGQRFDAWCLALQTHLQDPALIASERQCLEHFVHVTRNMREHLIECYDLDDLPRTNNDMEGFIRSIKTRYRRISGCKNWNRYLLRCGRRVSYYEASVRMGASPAEIDACIRAVPHRRWRTTRAAQRARQEEQLKQYRVRHRRAQFLAGLEARWAETTPRTGLLP